jgi:16S rRNA G527 N7-methylase RsmG
MEDDMAYKPKPYTCGELKGFEERQTHDRWMATVRALSKKLETHYPPSAVADQMVQARKVAKIEVLTELMHHCIGEAGTFYVIHKEPKAEQWREMFHWAQSRCRALKEE